MLKASKTYQDLDIPKRDVTLPSGFGFVIFVMQSALVMFVIWKVSHHQLVQKILQGYIGSYLPKKNDRFTFWVIHSVLGLLALTHSYSSRAESFDP